MHRTVSSHCSPRYRSGMCLELQQRRTFAVEKKHRSPLPRVDDGRGGAAPCQPPPLRSWESWLADSQAPSLLAAEAQPQRGLSPQGLPRECVCVWGGGTAPWGWISSGRRRAGGCGLQQPPPPGQALPQNIRKKGFIKHSLAVCPPVL